MRDPSTVAMIVNVLRQAHDDDLARVMLNDGFSLAILIDCPVALAAEKPRRNKIDHASA